MGRITISNTAALWSPADYSGTLYKRAGGCRPGWKKRFFVLKGSSLFYFTSAEDFSPRGVIPIEQATISEGRRTHGVLDRRDKYIISVTTHPSFQCSKPVYLLSARSSSGQEDWLQVLKAVTIPHADLAARVSKLSITEVTAAQADKEYDTVTVVRKMSGDGDDVEGEGDSEDEVEVEMAPDPSGNGALEGTAGQKPARGQKSLRFASMIEQHQGDEAEAGQKAATSGDTTTSGDTKKKFKKPKGSVFIKGEAFDFHGEELTEVDAAALADIENEAEGTPGDGVATSADTQQQMQATEAMATGPAFRPKAMTMQFPATFTHPTTAAQHQARMSDFRAYAQQQQFMTPLSPSPPITPQAPSPRDMRAMSHADSYAHGQQLQDPRHAQQMYSSMIAPSASLEVQTSGVEGDNSGYRAMAQSMAPFDWGDSGAPRFTTYMTAAQEQQQQLHQHMQEQQQMQEQELQHGMSQQNMLALPPMQMDPQMEAAMRQQAMSVHAGAAVPGGMRSTMQSMAPADWGSDGLPRFSQFARASDAVATGAASPEGPHQPQAHVANMDARSSSMMQPRQQQVSSRIVEERVRSRDGGLASMGSTGRPYAASMQAAGPQDVQYAELADARASAASIRAAAAQGLAPEDWSMPARDTTRMSVAPSMHATYPEAAEAVNDEFRRSTMNAAGADAQIQMQNQPPSPLQYQRSSQVAQYEPEHQQQQMLEQQQFSARQSQMEGLEHQQQMVSSAHMHAAQPVYPEQQAMQMQWQDQAYASMQHQGVQDAGAGMRMSQMQGVMPQYSESVGSPQAMSRDVTNTAAPQGAIMHAPQQAPSPTLEPHEPHLYSTPLPNLQPHMGPAHAVLSPTQQAQQPEAGSTMQDFSKTLENLKTTVASMQNSLQRSDSSTRSPSPSHERAAEALARARETLRTVAVIRNPGGHGKSTHARTATFDVADFSRSQAPVDASSNPRLARNATMESPRAAADYNRFPQQPMQQQVAQAFQNNPQYTESTGGNGGRLMRGEQPRGNLGSFVEPKFSAAMDQQQMMALQPGGVQTIRAHALTGSQSFNTTM